MSIEKEELISKIVDLEWNVFRNVSSVGGRAPCQEDRSTFEIMRYSQALSWSFEALESYLCDLLEAVKEGRNLMSEKYARMMKNTSSEEYACIKYKLKPLRPEILNLIDDIAGIVMKWEEELLKKYPHIVKKGRPLYSNEDTVHATSVETYLRSELATYSETTLKLYYQHIKEQKEAGINGSEIIFDSIVRHYGFNSLSEADSSIA